MGLQLMVRSHFYLADIPIAFWGRKACCDCSLVALDADTVSVGEGPFS